MHIRSFLFFLIIVSSNIFAQSPHGSNFKIDCSYCHESTEWKVIPSKIKFDHDSQTSFKLTGQHTAVNCITCHKSFIFSDIKSECLNCHKDVHQNSVGSTCSRCHTTSSWVVQNIIQIHKFSRLPLVGAHLNVDCAGCHKDYSKLYFPTLSISCFSCHSNDFNNTSSPNHINAGFSTECQDCHTLKSNDWTADNFNHNFFPLTGGHNISNCFVCHKQGSNFKGLTTNCYSCHNKDYVSTTDPNHTQLNFSHDCSQCHSIITWSSSTFDHSKTGFPLTGAHASIKCSQCHASGYSNTPTACYSCHQTDYDKTNNPPHKSAGFPTDCIQCHNSTAWQPSTFNHSQFPITSGRHSGLQCSDCHTTISNFAIFSCITCHTHNQANTDPHHGEVGGYVYSPTSCYGCHPSGSGGD